MPPRENPRLNISVDSVHASGPLGRKHVVIHGNSNYKQTGLMQAWAAMSLLQQPPRRAGFASGCQAFGHRELLGRAAPVRARARPGGDRAPMSLVALPRQGRLARAGRALPDDGRAVAVLRRGAGPLPPGRRGARALRRPAGGLGGDPVGQRPHVVRLRLRHRPRRGGVVPGQPAQRGGGEPRAARALRLHDAALPAGVRAARGQDPRPAAAAHDAGLPGRRRRSDPSLEEWLAGVDAGRGRRRAAGRRRRCWSAPGGRRAARRVCG